MNRLKILLITTALITGTSALATAEENHQNTVSVQVRLGDHEGGYFSFRGGDSDDRYRYFDRDDHRKDRDDRWRHDRDDRRGHDWNDNFDRR